MPQGGSFVCDTLLSPVPPCLSLILCQIALSFVYPAAPGSVTAVFPHTSTVPWAVSLCDEVVSYEFP